MKKRVKDLALRLSFKSNSVGALTYIQGIGIGYVEIFFSAEEVRQVLRDVGKHLGVYDYLSEAKGPQGLEFFHSL